MRPMNQWPNTTAQMLAARRKSTVRSRVEGVCATSSSRRLEAIGHPPRGTVPLPALAMDEVLEPPATAPRRRHARGVAEGKEVVAPPPVRVPEQLAGPRLVVDGRVDRADALAPRRELQVLRALPEVAGDRLTPPRLVGLGGDERDRGA